MKGRVLGNAMMLAVIASLVPCLACIVSGQDLNPPSVIFSSYTTPDGTVSPNDYISVNVSSSDAENDISTFIDFNRSLVLWMRMDDIGSGANPKVFDNSSYGNDGAAFFGSYQVNEGVMGKGFRFGPPNNFIEIPYSPSLNITDEITLAAWVKNYGSVNHDKIIVKRTQNDNIWPWELYALDLKGPAAENPALIISDGIGPSANQNVLISTFTLPAGEWAHLVGTFNGTSMKIYVNGSLKDTRNFAPFAIGTNSTPVTIGGRVCGAAPCFSADAVIDDVMIFSRALSPAEVEALYSNQSSRYVFHNFTNLDTGRYSYQGFSQDRGANIGSTPVWWAEVATCASLWHACCSSCAPGPTYPLYDLTCPGSSVCCTSCLVSPASMYFRGLMDNVAVYNRALSPWEIRSHYNFPDQFMFYPVEIALSISSIY